MKKFNLKNFCVFLLFFLIFSRGAFALGIHGKQFYKLLYTIYIENKPQGLVFCFDNQNQTIEVLGRVIYPSQKVNERGYTASKWAKPSAVAATSVNAIHIKTGDNTLEAKGVVFSIIPIQMLNPPANYNSFFSPDSSIYVDINAGTKIFGGLQSPFVGNPVYYKRGISDAELLEEDYVPEIGDVIIIQVLCPEILPKSIVFENKEGGLVKAVYFGDQEEIIGQVTKPVKGVGRFVGTRYSSIGRIRANHSGVIDISTSRIDNVGGFQIIPFKHSQSSEMANALLLTQWMIVAPIEGKEEFLEGMPPLFSGYLRPLYIESTLEENDWINKALERYLVDVKIEGSDFWWPMPLLELDPDTSKPLPDWSFNALSNVTHIRIIFPFELM